VFEGTMIEGKQASSSHPFHVDMAK